MALPATDAFTDTDGVQLTTHSANWTLNRGDFDIRSNQLEGDDVNASFSAAHWNADTFDNNQYSQIVLSTIGVDNNRTGGVAVRCASGSTATFYTFCASGRVGNASLLRKIVDGSQTNLTSGNQVDVNTVLRLEVNGTTLTGYDDGAENLSITDDSIASGYAGVSGYFDTADVTPCYDNWEGGNLGGAAAREVSVSESVGITDTPTVGLSGVDLSVNICLENNWIPGVRIYTP